MIRIFVSSVQREFARERAALRDYVRNNPALRRFFQVFLFEDAPASDRRPDELYLAEVERCDIYVGLFGDQYGNEDEEGLSPTEREFIHATTLGKHRLVFLRDAGENERHPKMEALIGRAQAEVIRKRFSGSGELVAAFYEALVAYMEENDLLRSGPFDAAPCLDARMEDLDPERIKRFVRTARAERQFPLSDKIPPEELLEHLDLLHKGRPTNAAVLLFGRKPQRFLLTSYVKCAHFHGTYVAKPIPSLQMYEGTVFEMVDHAVDFVLSKIALSVGTRAESAQVPVAYEIPKEVVREAIVNAVAHRDYTSNSSVQVMLFADRLEVLNAGSLPWPLTLEKLRGPHESVPGNRLLARAMYFVKYIEEMGTGTVDMIRRCAETGLAEPEFESAGGFVIRIRRAALAGRPVVFTNRTQSETREVREATAKVSGGVDLQDKRRTMDRAMSKSRELSSTAQEERSTTQETTQKGRRTTQEATSETTQETTQERRSTTQEAPGTTQDRILALIRAEPEITQRILAQRLGITPDGVKYHLNRLRKTGVIRHVGATKRGRWEVLK